MTKIQSDYYVAWKDGLIKATKSANATLTFVEEVIGLDSSGGSFTITLPDASSMENNKRVWFYDNGSANTNNITITKGSDTSILGGDYIISENNQVVMFELIDSVWIPNPTVYNPLLRRDFVTANNQISRTSTSFADALQKDFIIVEDATYKLGYVYQWRHEKKDERHRVQVRIDGVEVEDLRSRQYMGGDDETGNERMMTSAFTLVDLTKGTYDIDMQYSTSKSGERVYLNYRRLYLEKWS